MIDKRELVDSMLDELAALISSGDCDWDCIAVRRALEKDYGIVIWCCEDEADDKYFNVTIRTDMDLNQKDEHWGVALGDLERDTSNDDFDELENAVWICLDLYDKYKEV